MAADHQKKRLNGAATVGCSSGEQHDAKMKHYGSPKHGLRLSSHISLEWDDNRSLVVSKKEQIGLRWRDLTPFIDSDPQWDDVLADVCAIPPEILELENLEEVLSFEIWKTHLSEEERNILMQFLPRELEAQNVVQALLGGDNVNFGNPFLKWGASLCSGNIHPDIVLHQERCVKDKKRAYYMELRKYHNGIKEKLQKWKERWASCRSSEKEIVQNLWRSWMPMNKKVSSHTKASQSCDLEENRPGTSESCSWGADDKTCSSDYQNSLIKKGANPRKRKCFMKGKRGKLLVAPDGIKLVAMPRKGEKLHGPNIQCSDAAKYMSYFKISKKQYQLVKSMNHSGNSIQPRSLTRVLGNLDHFHIQPYEIFEEEEQKKLHEYWLQLTNVDLPVAFVDWKKRQLCRQQMFKSLEQELNIKLETSNLKEAEDKNTCDILKGLKNFRAEDHENTNEDDDKPVHLSAQNEALLQSPLNDGHILDAMELDAEDNNLVFQHDDAPLDVYSRNLNSSDIAGNQRASLSSCEDVWPEVSDPCSYSKEYASASEMPLGHSRVIEEQQAQLIDLKSGITEEMEKDLSHRLYNDEPLNTYFNQVGDELLQSLFKGQDSMFHQQQQSHAGLDLQATANMLMETDRYGEQLQSLGQLQNHQKELYIHQNIPNMLYDETKSFIPRQFHSPPVNLQDWVVNPIHMSAPPPSQLNNGNFFNLNMFSGGHQVHGDMSCSDGSSAIYRHGLGNGNGAQGSPFSMLPYSVLGSAAKGNCGIIAGGSMLKNNNALQQAANPLDYFSGNMGWMSLPHQNSTVHNSMGKQFLQSWNQ